jgi:starch phosphorylase
MAGSLLHWRGQLSGHWSGLRFGSVRVQTVGNEHRFDVQVYLEELDPNAIRVELYADSKEGSEPVRQPMVRGEPLVGESAWHYSANVCADRPAADFTPRVVPFHPEAFIPLEAANILWYR